jgi:hypothetical protein
MQVTVYWPWHRVHQGCWIILHHYQSHHKQEYCWVFFRMRQTSWVNMQAPDPFQPLELICQGLGHHYRLFSHLPVNTHIEVKQTNSKSTRCSVSKKKYTLLRINYKKTKLRINKHAASPHVSQTSQRETLLLPEQSSCQPRSWPYVGAVLYLAAFMQVYVNKELFV